MIQTFGDPGFSCFLNERREVVPFFKAVWAKKRGLAAALLEGRSPLPKGGRSTPPQGSQSNPPQGSQSNPSTGVNAPLQLMLTAAVCDQCSGAFPEILSTTGVCDQCLGAFIKLFITAVVSEQRSDRFLRLLITTGL